jgi:hypothetical protein
VRIPFSQILTALPIAVLVGLSAGQEKQPEPNLKTGSPFTSAELAEHTLHRRAIETVNWGMSAVNTELMYQAMVREAKGAFNQIAYWSHLPNWKNQTLTPNPDAMYFMPFINTKDVGRW